jgi:hypothetical protein
MAPRACPHLQVNHATCPAHSSKVQECTHCRSMLGASTEMLGTEDWRLRPLVLFAVSGCSTLESGACYMAWPPALGVSLRVSLCTVSGSCCLHVHVTVEDQTQAMPTLPPLADIACPLARH